MEVSPLIKAHDHAKAASDATRSSDSTVAVNEHALAAGEFSNAAKNTTSIEALRTLGLLEQHHKKLSDLLKFPHEQISQQSMESDATDGDEKIEPTGNDAEEKGNKKHSASSTGASASPAAAKPLPTLSRHQRRYPTRDLTSSIASNLASARGIRAGRRGQALSPSVSNDQAPGSLEVHPRRDGASRKTTTKGDQTGQPSWVPPNPVTSTKREHQEAMTSPQEEQEAPSEEGFSRFYNTFGSIFNKLSAPLAFAGLPLITEESGSESASAAAPEPAPQKRHRSRPPHSATIEPDLSKIYSKATLRALRGEGNGPSDSFYVVPTSGHTASYASILSFDQKERRRIAASVHGGGSADHHLDDHPDEEDFVDARESQGGPLLSPALRKRLGNRDKSDNRNLQNVVEELHLENASLKEMLDKLSKRLHAFEINSQSSHLALAQSLRLQRPGSPMSGSSGGLGGGKAADSGGGDEAVRRRNRELEEQMALTAQRMERLEQENAKLQQTLEKYRDRWEKLKAGAKARREGQGSAGNDGEASRGK